VKKVDSTQVAEMVAALGGLLVKESRAESRDIYSIGLKTVFQNVRESDGTGSIAADSAAPVQSLRCRTGAGSIIANKLAPTILAALKRAGAGADPNFVVLCLDVLRDLILRFGSEVSAGQVGTEHPANAPRMCSVQRTVFTQRSPQGELLDYLLGALNTSREAQRKRATATIGALSRFLNDELFHGLLDTLIRHLNDPKTPQSLLFTHIQTVGVIRCDRAPGGSTREPLSRRALHSQSAGDRVGKYLPEIVPKLLGLCKVGDQRRLL
jgi:hypothetical protein